MPENAGNNDMKRMQDEAIRRVRDMQKRAKTSVNNAVVEKVQNEEPKPIETKSQTANPLNNIFDSLMSDSERTLILILILLLSTEEADMGLILALMYLII